MGDATMYKKLLTLTAFMLAFSWVAALAPAGSAYATKPDDDGEHKVSICHRDNAASKPYVMNEVDKSAVDGGIDKGDHYAEHTGPIAYSEAYANELKDDKIKWGDIIPPVPGSHNGLNWTPLGQAMWANGCNFVTFVEPTTPEFVDPTCEADGSYTIPKVKGLKYYVNDVKTKAGTYYAKAGDTITVTVEAKAGYFIPAETQTEWTHDFVGPEVCGGDEEAQITFASLCTDEGLVITFKNDSGVNGYVTVNGTQYEVPANDMLDVTLPQDADGVEVVITVSGVEQFNDVVDCAPGEVLGETTTGGSGGATALPETAGELETIVSVLVATVATAGATIFGLRRLAQQ